MLLRIACSASAVSLLIASRVFAHAAPAAPPIFDTGPCIRVIDREAEPSARFGYRVALDDVQLTAGDIPVPDALTHQFFAFRGAIAFEGFAPELSDVESAEPRVTVLPLWITRRDVERAQASSDENTLGYDLSEVTQQTVLDTMASMQDRWLRITSEDARVPIAFEQALRGMYWDVRAVPPGLYTVASYIFSPPYNGWEIRSGLVKLVSKGSNPPAAVISRIQEALFAGQGRRVRGCLDVPPDTQLRTYFQLKDHPERGWMAWGEEQAVTSGDVDLCFQAPRELEGSMRIRFDLSSGGNTYTFYSPDTLLLLGGESKCMQSDTVCCPDGESPSEPMVADGGSDAATASAADGSISAPDAAPPAVDDDADAAAEPQNDLGGCGAAGGTRERSKLALLPLIAAVFWLRRSHRATHRR
jgi:hypothetical protein